MQMTTWQGMVSLVSADGLHQLHIFVFFLAVFHVAFSAITMSLGRAKTRIWKEWEKETCSLTYEFSYDPSKFRLTHQTSFVRQHASCWSKSTILLYFVSFFRQFFRSVRRTDYLTLRHGFIAVSSLSLAKVPVIFLCQFGASDKISL
jgi:mlo protein